MRFSTKSFSLRSEGFNTRLVITDSLIGEIQERDGKSEYWLSFFFFCFRAEIILGGYLLEELSSEPPKCRVTNVTRADLKGKALGLLAGWSEKMCHEYMP